MVICYSIPNWRDRDKTFKSEKWGIFNFMSGNQTEEKKFYLIYFNIAWNCIVHIAFPCFWIVVLEKTLESPLDCKEIKPVKPKGDQSWMFIGRTDVEAEAPILWPPDAKSQLIGKDPDAGEDWRQKENGAAED